MVNQESVVRKTQFPRLVIPLSVVVTSIFNLAVNLIVGAGLPARLRGRSRCGPGCCSRWSSSLLFVFATGVSLLLSSLYVRFRDTAIIWAVMVTALFYATPVLYPIEAVPSAYRTSSLLNPLTPLFVQARHWVIDPGAPTAVRCRRLDVTCWRRLRSSSRSAGSGAWYFNHEAPRIAEEL